MCDKVENLTNAIIIIKSSNINKTRMNQQKVDKIMSRKNALIKRKKRKKKQLQQQLKLKENKRLKMERNNNDYLKCLMRQQLSAQRLINTLKLLSEKLHIKRHLFDWTTAIQSKFYYYNNNSVNCVKTTCTIKDLKPTISNQNNNNNRRRKSRTYNCALRRTKVCHYAHLSSLLRFVFLLCIFLAANEVYATYAASIPPQESSSTHNILEALVDEQSHNNFELEYNNNKNNNNDNHNNHHQIAYDMKEGKIEEFASSRTDVEHLDNRTLRSYSIIDENSLSFDHMDVVAKSAGFSTNSEPIFDFGMPRNITARTGQGEAVIKCRVDALNDKSVSWIRKRDLHILSVGTATYTSDKRFEVTGSKDQREWALHVKAPQSRDSGIYECQINTEPKISMAFQLNIIEISPDAKAVISGPADLHFKVGSAIILSCVVQQPSVKDIGPIYWYRGEHMITPFSELEEPHDETHADDNNANELLKTNTNAVIINTPLSVISSGVGTGAISPPVEDVKRLQESLNEITQDFTTRIAMESQLGDTLKSRLRISNAQTTDTGNYTCQPTTASSASVMVHVINDENPAAMQKSAAVALQCFPATLLSDCITTLVAIQVMLIAFVLQHFELVISAASCLTTQNTAFSR